MNKKIKLFLLLNNMLKNIKEIHVFVCWIIYFFILYATRHYSTVFSLLPCTICILLINFVLYFNVPRRKEEEINKNMVLEENHDLALTIHKLMEKEKYL